LLIGYVNGNNIYFWQQFEDNGEKFLLTCTHDPKTNLCKGIWNDYHNDETGPW